LTCIEKSYRAATLELQTAPYREQWMTVAVSFVDQPSWFGDLVSHNNIQRLVAMKPHSFIEPSADEPTDTYSLTLRRVAAIDPETFTILEAIDYIEYRPVAIVKMNGVGWSTTIAVCDEGWWEVRCKIPCCKIPSAYIAVAGQSITHLYKSSTLMGHAPQESDADVALKLTRAGANLKLAKADVKTILQAAMSD